MRMTSDSCNNYEQITVSYLSSVLEYNIHKTNKGVECSRHYHDLYSNTSWFPYSHFNGENFSVIF